MNFPKLKYQVELFSKLCNVISHLSQQSVLQCLHFLTDVFFTVSDSGAHMVWQHLRDESGNKMNAATKVCTNFLFSCFVVYCV